ncbi:MAG: acetate--CoA ligase family protein [Thermodesulfobacteriota bacterium]
MNAAALLHEYFSRGKKSLNESEAKQVLSACGIPVVPEKIAKTPEEAAAAADELGFPVAVKGLSDIILHKTEAGLVALNLADAGQARAAAAKMAEAHGPELSGFLVSPMITGRREFVAGIFRDPLFGPVIMFGIGGIFTEALRDVSFRLAPLTPRDISAMMEEIRANKLFTAFRDEAAVRPEDISAVLMGLSRLASEAPELAEADLNPLIADKDGRLVAVDALITLAAPAPPATFRPPVPPARVGRIFYPRSIAFVGASEQLGKWGHMVLAGTIAGGYEGKIYLVNPKGGEIMGRPVFRSLAELPDGVDLVVVTIPAGRVAALLPEMQQKKMKHMLLITSGFSETGPEGKALELSLAEDARSRDILIVGPNTMGLTNPHVKLFCMGSHIRTLAGTTALVAQSGNMGAQLMGFASKEGIGIRAFCGSGNEAMITIEDALECFEQDDLTGAVVLYIESVKDGRRFFESARRVGKQKPVVVLKGGRTEAGGRAAASHTGAMAADHKVMSSVFAQAGIVQVGQPMDLLDLSAAFSSLPLPRGRRVAIMTLGGGWGVVTADLCAEWGLDVVPLPDELIGKINAILPPFWSHGNPIDLVGESDPTIPRRVSELLMAWEGCDALLNMGIMGRSVALKRMIESEILSDPAADRNALDQLHKALVGIEDSYAEHLVSLMETYGKPILGVPLTTEDADKTVRHFPGRKYNAVFYKTPERAVKALAKMYEYNRYREGK